MRYLLLLALLLMLTACTKGHVKCYNNGKLVLEGEGYSESYFTDMQGNRVSTVTMGCFTEYK